MEIKLYPLFEEVFVNQDLKGIFYPLCTVQIATGEKLHFVSHNGIWTNSQSSSEQNTDSYVCFEVKEGKYTFTGDINLYQGYQDAPMIHQILVQDFEANGIKYWKQRTTEEDYAKQVQKLLPNISSTLDVDTYIEFFYAYALNKLVFEQTGQFGKFRQLISSYAKAATSPYVYTIGSDTYEEILHHTTIEDELPSSIILDRYKPIGVTIGHEFFTDGNDCLLYYNTEEKIVICVNSYS
ncbi:MAG: hypothetical protein LBI72_08900 [Flavobacteriaceae bacterium]|jgi:hypothetical protein|nr:hypothetical protein [Flavobacteriaceae bacterium]